MKDACSKYIFPSKEHVRRNGGKAYSVPPYALLWNNDTYYLVGFHDHRQQIAKFRVDRIDGLELTLRASVKKPRGFTVTEYFHRSSPCSTARRAGLRCCARTSS